MIENIEPLTFRKLLFSPSFWKKSFIATFIGAVIGTLVVNQISTMWLEKALPLIILAAAIYTIWHPHPKTAQQSLPQVSASLYRKQWLQDFACDLCHFRPYQFCIGLNHGSLLDGRRLHRSTLSHSVWR